MTKLVKTHPTTLSKILGGSLLVAGTTIGVSLLALPATTGLTGFFPSVGLFIFFWLIMLLSGFFFIEVSLLFKGQTNLISMAQKMLGSWGKIISWIVYLLLCYSLIAAYISSIEQLILSSIPPSLTPPIWFLKILLPLIFAPIIYLGTTGVDWINRVFMIGLMASYLLILVLTPTHMVPSNLLYVNLSPFILAVPVILSSFGYHIIIPTLTTYMNHDKRSLYLAIIIGSILALLINIFWQLISLGTVPVEGNLSLMSTLSSGQPITITISKIINRPLITSVASSFAFFAVITSFMGVSLSLSDFLIDGFKIKKTWEGKVLANLLTFVPPLIFVFSSSKAFYVALEYAGACVAILLVLIPALMALKLKKPQLYRSKWTKLGILCICLVSLFVVLANFFIQHGQYV